MSNKIKKDIKKESKKTGGSIFLKFFAMLMLVASAILVYSEYVIDIKKPLITESHVMKVHIETGENSKLAGEETENKLEEKAADEAIKDNEISAIISEDFKIQASVQERLEQYRVYLYNVAHLLEKFLQHEDYEMEVEFLLQTKDDYPNDVVKLLDDLRDYRDEYLSSKDVEYTKLDLEDSFATRMINKIVNIEKKNPQYEIREGEYTKLKSQLNSLTIYFYSKEFLKKYLGND